MNDFDYEQMMMGELYLARNINPENSSQRGKLIAEEINKMSVGNRDKIIEKERKLFGKSGKILYVTPPIYVAYGSHIEVGENFYANKDCIFMDINTIRFGNNVIIGPRCSFYCAGHPLAPEVRNRDRLEFGLPIQVGDDVWIGGNSVILPGITIGNNSVIGAGSVVTKDVPEDVVVAGNPAKVIKNITEKEKEKWGMMRDDYYSKRVKFINN